VSAKRVGAGVGHPIHPTVVITRFKDEKERHFLALAVAERACVDLDSLDEESKKKSRKHDEEQELEDVWDGLCGLRARGLPQIWTQH